MGVYTTSLEREVRLERMRPEQVAAARTQRPAIYAAFGSIEWHGRQNAVGLDALKAHEQLVGLASRVGGVVYPAIYFGSGGGHLDWPSSFMVSAAPMTQLVHELLAGFERDGYRYAVLLSGHYPNTSEYLKPGVAAYRDAGGTMETLVLVETQIPQGTGDHAAKYETSSMLHLHPETVALEPAPANEKGAVEPRNWMTPEYQGHPCYGLVGVDPRGTASAELGRETSERLIAFLEAWLSEA